MIPGLGRSEVVAEEHKASVMTRKPTLSTRGPVGWEDHPQRAGANGITYIYIYVYHIYPVNKWFIPYL